MNQCPNCKATVDTQARFCKFCAVPVCETNSTNMPSGSTQSNKEGLIISATVVAALLIAGGITGVLVLAKTGPTKEKAIQTMREFLAAYKSGNVDKMRSLVKPSARRNKTDQDYFNYLRLTRSGQNLAVAIDVLAAKGKWGKSVAIHKVIGGLERCADDLEISLDNCYTLLYNEDSGIDFHWDGKKLLIIRFDDIGDIK